MLHEFRDSKVFSKADLAAGHWIPHHVSNLLWQLRVPLNAIWHTRCLWIFPKARCHKVGIKLNRDKLDTGVQSLTFMGNRISADGLLPYFNYRDELTIHDGIVYRGDRVVIPTSLRREVKEKVHIGHLCINSCQRSARDLIFWLGMSAEIRQYIETCATCATFLIK